MNLEQLFKRALEATDVKTLFIALLCLFTITLFPVTWDGNEENYFQLSYQTVEPTAFPENHAIFDASNGRIVPEHIIGYMVKLFGYETSHALVRLLAILGYALSLALLFSNLRLRVLDCVLIVSVFLLAGQQLFGGAWLFRGGESKVFAYIFVFLSIHNCFAKRFYISLIWLAAATYMHFLVGLFWTVFIYSTVFLYQRSPVELIKHASFFTLIMSPLLALLVPELLVHSDATADFSSDYIYTRIRNPHHTDPFQSLYVFLASWSIGIAKLLCIMGFCIYLLKRNFSNWLAMLTLVSGGYLLLFLLISFIDRETLFFGKFYLFRPTGLVLLFGITLMIVELKKTFANNGTYLFIGLFCFITAVLPIAKSKVLQINTPEPRYATENLIESIENNTRNNDIVLLDPANKWDTKAIQLVRDVPRPTLVEWKFVPTQKIDIIRWRNLMNMKEELFADGCKSSNREYRYLITFSEIRFKAFSNCAEILYQDENLIFFKIEYP